MLRKEACTFKAFLVLQMSHISRNFMIELLKCGVEDSGSYYSTATKNKRFSMYIPILLLSFLYILAHFDAV